MTVVSSEQLFKHLREVP